MLSGISVSPLLSAAKSAQAGRRALGVVEQPVALAEDEVVLVPEAILALQAERIGDQIVDGEVVLLGPRRG